jgi:hypothetical protein
MDPTIELIRLNLDDKADHWRKLAFTKKTLSRLTKSESAKQEMAGEIKAYNECAGQLEALARLLRPRG